MGKCCVSKKKAAELFKPVCPKSGKRFRAITGQSKEQESRCLISSPCPVLPLLGRHAKRRLQSYVYPSRISRLLDTLGSTR